MEYFVTTLGLPSDMSGADPAQASYVRKFWTGSGWSEEYPDALLYSSSVSGDNAGRAVSAKIQGRCEVYESDANGYEPYKQFECGYETMWR